MKINFGGCDFAKSYSPCVRTKPPYEWYQQLEIPLPSVGVYTIFISEPNLDDSNTRQNVVTCLEESFSQLPAQAGYYDLPDVRDFVCERLRFPEAAFDDAINILLDQKIPPVTVGLTYERISGRRKPMVRVRGNTQVFNLIRKG
jgi:hypothetical protein